MKTLVQINSGLGFGSVGRIADQIGTLAEQEGWNCYYAHGTRYKAHECKTAIPVGGKLTDYIHYAISLLTGRDGIGSYFATKRLVRQLKKISPDVVHLHNIHGSYLNYKVLFDYLAEANIPVIWTLHDCWAATGHCAYFDSVNCEKWKTGCHNCQLIHEFPKSLFFDQSSWNQKRKIKAINSVKNLTLVPVSNWLGDIMRESLIKNASIQVIHNGIDLKKFKPVESDIKKKLCIDNDKITVIGLATGWDERKGYSDFVKLANTNLYNVIMVGNIDVDSSNLPSSIIHIKHTDSQQQLAMLYSAADVFINPTYSDNFPTTNIEALACGTPVVTYKTGGSPEAIDENTGIVVERGNLNELINAINTIVEQKSKFNSYACRKRAEAEFEMSNQYCKYIELYNNLIKKDVSRINK